MAQTAFVTGGTGFIGFNLIELLVNEGWQVTALHRSTSNLQYLNRFPVALREGSVTDRESLDRAIAEGTDVVFHVAGDTNFWSKRNAQQNAINIDGTRNLVEAASQKGVRTFVHTSSVSAWGRVKGVVTEQTPLAGKDSWINYERSKHLGELEALKGTERGMKVVVLNPGGVAGPYDANTWGQLFFMLRDGALPAASPGTVTISHVHDVVAAHLAAVTRGQSGQRYILASNDIEIVELVGEVARLLGLSKVPRTAPPWVLKAFGRLSVMLAALTGTEPKVTPEIATMTSERGTSFRSDKAI
ncbi:MAG: NAD-dependent epimerase/dehydratase family protein, partial [Myxococcales bacterium]